MRLFDQACGPDESASVGFFTAWSMNSLIESFLFEVREIKRAVTDQKNTSSQGMAYAQLLFSGEVLRASQNVSEKKVDVSAPRGTLDFGGTALSFTQGNNKSLNENT